MDLFFSLFSVHFVEVLWSFLPPKIWDFYAVVISDFAIYICYICGAPSVLLLATKSSYWADLLFQS